MCFLCLALSELVVGGSNVNVARVVVVSFLNRTAAAWTTTSKPGSKEELGSLGQAEWFLLLLLHTTDIKVLLCTEDMSARYIKVVMDETHQVLRIHASKHKQLMDFYAHIKSGSKKEKKGHEPGRWSCGSDE